MRTGLWLLRAAVGSTAFALVASPAPAQAKHQFVVTEYVGVFVPSNDLARTYGATSGRVMRQRPGPAVGANLSYWVNARVSIELGAAYASTDAEGSLSRIVNGEPVTGSLGNNAHVWLTSAKVLIKLLPEESRYNVRLGFGPAIVSRRGAAYTANDMREIGGLTDAGAAMSLCTRLPITSTMGLRLRAESFVYQSKLRFMDRTTPPSGVRFPAELQGDVILSAGLQVTTWR